MKAVSTLHPHLVALASPPELARRVDVLGEVVHNLLERTEVLEEQRSMLLLKVEMLEERNRPGR